MADKASVPCNAVITGYSQLYFNRYLLDILNISRIKRGLLVLKPFSLEKLFTYILLEFKQLYIRFHKDG